MMDILNFNRQCAEFLGATIVLTDHTEGNEDYCKAAGIDRWIIETWTTPDCMKHLESVYGWGCFRFDNQMKYHSDWNWLMQVVEKIESLQSGIFQVDILQEGCTIRLRCKSFIDSTVRNMPNGTTKMQAVVDAVGQFLTWYNDSFSN